MLDLFFKKILVICIVVLSFQISNADEKYEDKKAFDLSFSSLIELNHRIAETKQGKNPDNALILEQEKDALFEKITLDFIASKEDLSDRYEETSKQIQDLRQEVRDAILKDPNGRFEKEKLQIAQLELIANMQSFMLNLRERIGFFSQEEDVKRLVSQTLSDMRKTHFKIENSSVLSEKWISDYEDKYNACIEILNYFFKNPLSLLPRNALLNLSVGFILEKIDHLIPLDTTSLILSKILLSIVALVILLAVRKVIAQFFFILINLVVHFSNKDKTFRDKFTKAIVTPITTALLLLSFDISINILYYPNNASQKLEVWFGVGYITIAFWFLITLIKSYGTGLMANFLNKKDGVRKEAINLILKVSNFFVFIIGVLVVLKYLGFNVSAILASLGIGGLAVALALKDMLANFFASVMLLFENSFSQGDWIVCDGVEGTVVEIGLRRTMIRTFDNALILMPNSALAGGSIINWTRRKVGRRIKMTIGLTYDSSSDQIRKCIQDLRDMLTNHPDIAKIDKHDITHYEEHFKQDIISMQDYFGYKDSLYVTLNEFADSSINILIYCFTQAVGFGDFLQAKENILFEIMRIVEENNLSFAFPSQSVYVETFPTLPMEKLDSKNS